MRVLVLAPHADDEVLGVGGTIARHVARGDEVYVGILTTGNPAYFSPESVEKDDCDAREAHRRLGVKKTFFCHDLLAPGMDLAPQYKVTEVIRGWLQEAQPDLLYIPHRGDIHLDHRLTYQAALVAARPGYSSVRRILAYETLSETEWAGPSHEDAFLPNIFVDISDYLETKHAAMLAYEAQIKQFPNPRSLEGIDALARMRGSTIQAPAAEAFALIREIVQ
ncbi:MAG: PIG-L deacetylase family protein [Caldilineaceae bacterium]